MGRDLIDSAAETRLILTHHLPAQHFEHLGSGPLDDGHSGQQSWSQMQRQDGICRCRQASPFDDIIEIWNDCAEHPESPRFVLTGKGSRHASHQQKARDFGRRSPGSDARPVIFLGLGGVQ